MILSLMTLNPVFPLFMNPDFTPKASVSCTEYETVLSLAKQAGYQAVDLSSMEFDSFGAQKVKSLLDKYSLSCGSIILFENYAAPGTSPISHTRAIIDAAVTVGCKTLMLVASLPDLSISRDAMRECLISNFRQAVEYASGAEVDICIEDFPSTVIPMCSRTDIQTLLEKVPGLKLVYDSANMLAMGEDPDHGNWN